MKRVYIVQSSYEYQKMFEQYGFTIVDHIYEADLVCFTGGSDVSAYLYGDSQHPLTYNDVRRDEQEKEVYRECLANGLPMVGICRGGQFLNVMNGGRMYQHVTNHAIGGLHWITTDEGEMIRVTSTHHQMFMPRLEDSERGERAIIIATANEYGDREWMEDGVIQSEKSYPDYEVILYPTTRSLCFQPHPEMMPNSRMTSWFFELIEEYCFKKEVV